MSEQLPIVKVFLLSCIAISACGGGVGSIGGGTASLPQSFSVEAATSGAGGSINPTRATVTAGGSATCTLIPSAGYELGAVTGRGGTLSANTFTTAVIQSDCTVRAAFAAFRCPWEMLALRKIWLRRERNRRPLSR
jgi:hypothetical protein